MVINVFAKKTWQTIVSLIFGVIFSLSLLLMVLNVAYHYGMEQVTKTKVVSLVSSGTVKGPDMLLYEPLGNGKETVYLYKTSQQQKKPESTGTSYVTNTLSKGGKEAQLTIHRTVWEYKTTGFKRLFDLGKNDQEFVKETNQFVVPNDWLVLTTNQLKIVQKEMSSQKDKMELELKRAIEQRLQEAMLKNPDLDKKEQATMIEQASQQFEKEQILKIIEEKGNKD